MKFNNPYWPLKTRMQLLQRWIIVHSIIYYEYDSSVVSDIVFDDNAKQLYEMIANNKVEFKKTRYYYCFKDFDGTTGFDLYNKLCEDDKYCLEADALNLMDKKFAK